MLPESFLTELKYRSDIEQIVSSYVVLKRAGRNLKGLCPFHSEKSPSFVVYPENQSFYCFGCGAGGDVVTFIRKIENLDYMEAIRLLAERAGLPLPENSVNDDASRLKGRILEMNKEAARYFHAQLMGEQGRKARQYLINRGLAQKTVTRFGIGYAPQGWNNLRDYLRGKGFRYEEMEQAALVTKGRKDSVYDAFRDRVIFPIIDLRGHVIAFGGRILEGDGPKYLNSGDTPVFKKSRNLFAMNLAKSTKETALILAEGYMDVVSIHQAGFDNAIATLGTALTQEQARLISQYTGQVVIAYDSDGPGQAATRRAINLFDEVGVKVRVLSIPDAKDPDEFIKKFGPSRFRMLIEGSANAVEYEITKLSTRYDCTSEDGKVSFLKEFCQLMAGIRSPIERDVYIGKWAAQLQVSRDAIQAQVTSIQRRMKKNQERRQERDLKVFSEEAAVNRQDPQRSRNIKYALAEDKVLVILMKNPDYYPDIASQLAPEDFVTDLNRSIYVAICDRLRENLPADMMSMAAVLDETQVSRLSWLLASSEALTFTRDEAAEYIKTIKSHALVKTGEQLATMDDQELNDYIKKISATKK